VTSDHPFKPPPSGVIVGALAKVFQLDLTKRLDGAARKAASRFFEGQQVGAELVRTVLIAVAEGLLEAKLIPSAIIKAIEQDLIATPPPEGVPQATLGTVLGDVLLEHCSRWDAFVGQMRSASAPVSLTYLAALAYARLALVDLSLRIGAARHHDRLDRLSHDEPAWAQSRRRSMPLRRLLDQCRPAPPTTQELAERIETDTKTIEKWLSPTAATRPLLENISVLADELAARIPDTRPEDIAADLTRHYSLAALADQLTTVVGRDAVLALARASVRLSNRVMAFFDLSGLASSDRESAQRGIVLLGARYPPASFILNHLAKQEDDPVWVVDLRTAGTDWVARLRHVARVVGSIRREVVERAHAAGVSDEELDAAARLLQGSPELLLDLGRTHAGLLTALDEASLHTAVASSLYMAHRSSEALGHARLAVQKDPNNAESWLLLGAILSELEQFDASLDACREALKVRPDWETAAVEIGIVLLDAGRPVEAAEHLRMLANERPEATVHLRYHLAVALYRTRKAADALELLEEIIEAEPLHAHAIDLAAHCCLDLARRRKAKQYAKMAAALGMPEAIRVLRQRDAGKSP
jgi:tetratricopeptide (TPR) repeat protein